MIDYALLDKSINYYSDLGFSRVESPWAVTEEISDLTKPEGAINFKLEHSGKCLVASGEQSFLYLYLKDFLPKGEFQTITPCFRHEPFDFLHTKYFIKNELIKTDKVDEEELWTIVNKAYSFFDSLFPNKTPSIVRTSIGFDIEIEGNELGSYGIRTSKFLKWIYGTACAEPRTSNLIKLYGIS